MLGDRHRCTGALDLCHSAVSFALASVVVTVFTFARVLALPRIAKPLGRQ